MIKTFKRLVKKSFFLWLILRIYEFGFVLIISLFLELILLRPFYLSLMERIILFSKQNIGIWSFFLVFTLYWLTSLLSVFFVIIKDAFSKLGLFNFMVYFIHSTLVLLIFRSFDPPFSQSFILWTLIWISTAIFNYFSPRFLPQSLKQAFRS